MKSIPQVIQDKELQSVVEAFCKPENEVQKVLRKALERLGPNGEYWYQGGCWMGDKACAMTSLGRSLPDDNMRGPFARGNRSEPGQYLTMAANRLGHTFVSTYNDKAKSFAEIQQLYSLAITLAGES